MTDPREPNPFSFLDPPASTEVNPSSVDANAADADPDQAESESAESEQHQSDQPEAESESTPSEPDATCTESKIEESSVTSADFDFTQPKAGSHATEETEGAPEEDAAEEDEEDVPLPSPLEPSRPAWLGLLFFSEFAVIVLAVMLVFVQLWMYLPIVRNVAVGVALGWCLSKWPKQGFTHHVFLLLATVAGVFSTFVLYLALLYLYHLQAIGELSYWMQISLEFKWESFEYFLSDLLEQPIFGYHLGTRGNLVMWSAEFFITFWVAWPMVRTAKQFAQLDSVPLEVLEHVISMRQDSCSSAEIRRELHSLGWLRPEDQNQALAAGDAFIRLMPKKKKGKR